MTLQVNEKDFETGTKRRYFDTEAVREQFPDSAERMADATQGLGPGRLDKRTGRIMRKDRKDPQREVVVSDKELRDVYLAGEEVADPAHAS